MTINVIISIILLSLWSCTTNEKYSLNINQLEPIDSNTNSNYIKDHLEQKVRWYKWNTNNIEIFKTINKPIFMHIGYFGCHWCNKMSQENFNDEKTAHILNNHYISVIVDKDELPEVNNEYLEYQKTIMGQQGWPANFWLLPNLLPYYATSYLPRNSTQNYSLNFIQTLNLFLEKFKYENTKAISISKDIVNKTKITLNNVTNKIIDQKYGGYNFNSKFIKDYPLLAEQITAYIHDDKKLKKHIEKTINYMITAGIYDKVNGGIHRYSTTNDWEHPHFEKTLADNSYFIQVLSNQYFLTKNKNYLYFANKTIRFIEQFLKLKNDLFSSLISADVKILGNNDEGKFYLYKSQKLSPKCFKQYKGTTFWITSLKNLVDETINYCNIIYSKIKPITMVRPRTDERSLLIDLISYIDALYDFGIKTNSNKKIKYAKILNKKVISTFIKKEIIFENCSVDNCRGVASKDAFEKLVKLNFKLYTHKMDSNSYKDLSTIINIGINNKEYKNSQVLIQTTSTLNFITNVKFANSVLKENSYFIVIVGDENNFLAKNVIANIFPYEAIFIKNENNRYFDFFKYKTQKNNQTTIYICSEKLCLKPINSYRLFLKTSIMLFRK